MKLQLLKEPRTLKPWVETEATIAKFGYDPRWFKPNSFRIVVCKCTACGQARDRNLRAAELHPLCLPCSNRKNANINIPLRAQKIKARWEKCGHPRTGVKHTLAARKKISDHHQANPYSMPKEQRQKFSIRFSGMGNPFYGKKHTFEALEKMSRGHCQVARRGKTSNFYGRIYHGKGSWVKCSRGRIWVRSSWEAATAKYLDIEGYSWQYEPKAFELDIGTYTPDFFIETLNLYVEVKGYWREDARAKFAAFKAQYPQLQIEIWDKPRLKGLGII